MAAAPQGIAPHGHSVGGPPTSGIGDTGPGTAPTLRFGGDEHARERADAVSSAGLRGSQLRWRRVFAGQEPELSALRGWLRSLLPGGPARDDVIIVADELASNAIQHTASGRGGCFAVEVTWSGPLVRVAVADGGAPGGPRMVEDPAGEHGRGLVVVAALSARTGVCGGRAGRLVWAEIPWDAGAAELGSARRGIPAVGTTNGR
jgi:serine/threonine-protein kinase RsbW